MAHQPRPGRSRHLCIDGDKVDCHWPEHGLSVELHSYRFHATREALENDLARRRRSNHIPFSWGDVFDRGSRTATEVAELLRRASLRGSH